MADLVTRLILDNSNFERNVRQSEACLNTFRGAGNTAMGMLSKFAGAAGLAMGGIEMFSTAIESNQRLQSNWNTAVGTAKESVESFFTSLTTGDWSVFEDGIIGAIRLSKKYTEALQNLKTNLLIGDIGVSDDEKELNKYDNIASNESLSKKEREKGFDDFKKKSKEAQLYVQQLSEDSNKNLQDMLSAKGLSGLDAKTVKNLLRNYYPNFTKKGKQVDMYEKWQKDLPSVLGTPKSPEQIERAKKAIARLDKEDKNFANAAKLRMNFPEESEDLQQLTDLVDKIIGLEDRAQTMVTQDISLSKDFDELGHLKETQTKKAAKSAISTVSNVSNVSSSTDLSRLDNMAAGFKLSLPVGYTMMWSKNLGELKKEESELIKELNGASSHKDVVEIEAKLKFNRKKQKEITDGVSLGVGDLPEIDIDLNPDMGDQRSKGQKLAEEFAEGYATTIGNADFSTQEGREAVARETIESIKALIVAKAIESAMSLPFPANIIAAPTAAAAVAGLFSLIPKFSTGGIFEGNSNFGDMNLARVNAGEMILNNRQQRNLFNLLNNGGASNTMNGGNVTFKIEGKQLVGVLHNYNSKISKVR